MSWIGVDLDGTLAKHVSGAGVDTIGEPIPAMVERVKRWLAEGQEVRIVTARVGWHDHPSNAREVYRQQRMIGIWCEKHIGQHLDVTCEKDYEMVELWDDRAVGVVRNTGQKVTDYEINVTKEIVRGAVETEIKDYDTREGIESDTQAFLDDKDWISGDHSIRVVPMAPGEKEFHVTPREARVLAAQLLRAADEADART